MSAQPRATLSRRCVHALLAIAFPAASRRFANSAITASSLRLLFCNQRRGERGQRVGPWGRPLCAASAERSGAAPGENKWSAVGFSFSS